MDKDTQSEDQIESTKSRRQWSKWLNALTVSTTTIAAVLSVVLLIEFLIPYELPDKAIELTDRINDHITYYRKQVDTLKVEIEELRDRVIENTEISDTLKVRNQLLLIEKRIGETNEKIKSLENIIIENPEKALSIALLKKDLDFYNKTNDKQISSLREEVARIYDLSKWLIGIIITLTLTIIGFLARSLIKKE